MMLEYEFTKEFFSEALKRKHEITLAENLPSPLTAENIASIWPVTGGMIFSCVEKDNIFLYIVKEKKDLEEGFKKIASIVNLQCWYSTKIRTLNLELILKKGAPPSSPMAKEKALAVGGENTGDHEQIDGNLYRTHSRNLSVDATSSPKFMRGQSRAEEFSRGGMGAVIEIPDSAALTDPINQSELTVEPKESAGPTASFNVDVSMKEERKEEEKKEQFIPIDLLSGEKPDQTSSLDGSKKEEKNVVIDFRAQGSSTNPGNFRGSMAPPSAVVTAISTEKTSLIPKEEESSCCRCTIV
jgi:hypothetical protein